MRARKRLSYLLAGLLLLQVFCAPVFASGQPGAELTYDSAARTVSVRASGFDAYAMISLTGYYNESLDYLNQYTADEEGSFEVTYPSSAEWAEGGVIKVIIGAEGLSEPLVRSVTITGSGAPYIKYYTNSLTKGFSANILVEIGNPVAGLTAEVDVGGNTYKASFAEGETSLIKITEAINETELTLRLMDGGEMLESKTVEMKEIPQSIWSASAERSGNDLRVIFAAAVAEGPKGYSATINGVAAEPVQDGAQMLKFENVNLLDINKVVISGVKFPDYFPSYSFTFTLNF